MICPTPGKVSFFSRREAKDGLKRARGKGSAITVPGRRIHVYLCSCGVWHLGTVTSADALTQIRKSA